MHAFSGRFSRTCLEGISFNFFVCFIFNVSLGSAPKRKNFDIQRNTRVASGGQFTLNYHTPSQFTISSNSPKEETTSIVYDNARFVVTKENILKANWNPNTSHGIQDTL